MELQLKPHPVNLYPLGGVLIKGQEPSVWVREIQWMGYSLSSLTAYAIPGNTANSLWGCLLVPAVVTKEIGRNYYCQLIGNRLFIPENALLFPALTEEESHKLFRDHLHIFHPDFGLVELTEPIQWEDLLVLPVQAPVAITAPAETVFVPQRINGFFLQEIPPEEVLKALEEEQFPQRKKFNDKPLNIFEKIKLGALRLLFQPGGLESPRGPGSGGTEPEGAAPRQLPNWLQKINSFFTPKKEPKWVQKLQMNLEDLEERNRKEMDKLLDLFRNNPEEALKYAIPLDEGGSARGGHEGAYNLSKRWLSFSLFDSSPNSSRSGTVTLSGDHYQTLRNQYIKTAEQLIAEQEFQKAAFIYMKLLKDYNGAADTLEGGQFFQEAAAIHLKHTQNKVKAAGCYEKGRMIPQAIELYKELNQNEKVGDLYLSIHKKKEAHAYFEKVIESYRSTSQYVKASLIYKNKIEDPQQAQSLLMEGWRRNKDAFNCLNNYFSNIPDLQLLEHEITQIYATDTPEANKEVYLRVLKHEFDKHVELEETTREIAYQIIAERVAQNPSIVSELPSFNKKDKQLLKDVLKYKQRRRGSSRD